MQKKIGDSMKTILLIFFLVFIVRVNSFFPWWSFVIPVFALGIVISLRKWQVPSFAVGFISGFLIWFGANLYFDLTFNGAALYKIGILLSVPKGVVMLISGLMGGMVNGLALFTGKTMVAVNPASTGQ